MRTLSALWTILFFTAACLAAPAGEKILNGHVPEAAKHLTAIGRLPGSQQLHLAIGLSLRNQDQLTALIQELYDPASPNFHRYLTPKQFTERFGPSEADYQAAIAFARASGFTIRKTHPNRMLLDVDASVADIEKALNIRMQLYQHPTEARIFYAPDQNPSVPAALAILDISGLSNFRLPHPKLQMMSPEQLATTTPHAGGGSGWNGLYAGNDFRAAYAPGTTLTGSGQSVALLEFDGYYASDIADYEASNSLPNVPLQNVLIDSFTGAPGGQNTEVALDIEMAVSMAPGLSSVIVYEAPGGSNPNDILNQMVIDDSAKQISSSWGWGNGPSATTDQIFQEMIVQGQSYFNASGDSDAFPPGAVDNPSTPNAPSSSPYVTQVGGTELTTTGPGGSWVSETVWNVGSGVGSSGGISSYYPIPYWQEGLNMAAAQGSTTMRNIPDVAMLAYAIWVISDNGNTTSGVQGTSAAAPLWAGFTALVNQQAAALGKPPVGFLNPALYRLGQSARYAYDFHDITTGNNFSPTSPSNFNAVASYDLCTGWGTPTGTNLIKALIPDDLTIMPTVVAFASSGPVRGPFSPTSLNLTLTNTGTAALNWSVTSVPGWLSVSPSSGSLTPGGPATPVTISIAPSATNLPAGNYSANVAFNNLNDGIAQIIPAGLMVELLLNGGFETGDFTDWTLNSPSGNPSFNLVTNTAYPFDPFPPHSGNYLALLGESGGLAYLSQTIPTIPGQLYQISFWLNTDDSTPNEFLFNWNGQTLFDQVNITTFTQYSWTNLQFTATATASNTVIEFGAENDNSYFGLDDVSVLPVIIPPLAFQSISKSGSSLQLTWNSSSGAVYQLQYNTNLAGTNWVNIGNAITATTATVNTSTAITTDRQRFYRVEQLP